MSQESSKTPKQVKKKKYTVPQNKKEMIKAINEKGIQDIICMSTIDEGRIEVSFEIRTKDKKCFNIGQEVVIRPVLAHVEVLDCSTGNCYEIETNMGSAFDHKKYDYNADSPWEIEI
jgi:hypothetical protein